VSADRNLLFGMLALHNGIITREQLLDAMNDWMLQKSTPLSELLRGRGALGDDDRQLIDGLVARQIKLHGGPEKSLASLRLSAEDQEYLTQVTDEFNTGAPATIFSNPAPVVAGTGGRYRRLRLFAKGGLGEVYVAMDEELHREVVLKQIQDRLADHPESRGRFVREAEITANLEHPGVVPVYGLISDATGRPAYAMRFIHGESLQERVTRFHEADRAPSRDPGERTLALRELLSRFVAVCNAVGYAHSKGVIHRDIKPSNVMLGDYGETLVVDWGLARILGDEQVREAVPGSKLRLPAGDSTATQAGEALGTPAYMPPEQATGRNELVGVGSDVFSLGATLYCVLTGQAPYTGADALERARQCRFTPPVAAKPGVPRPLEAVVLRAMAPQPEDRYESAVRLAADVERYLADEPVSAYHDPLNTRFRRWAKRRRTLVTSVVVLMAASVLLLGERLWAVRREKAQTNAQLARAEHNLDLAKEAVDKFYALATKDPLLGQPRMRQVRRRVFEEVLPFYQDFQAQRPDDPGLPREMAEQRYRVALILHELGRKQEAARAFEEAIALSQGLASRDPADPAPRRHAGQALKALAVALIDLGRREDARATCERACDLQRELVKQHPDAHDYQADLALSYSVLGGLLNRVGQRGEAMRAFTEARDLLAPLVRRFPLVASYTEELAGAWTNIGLCHNGQGDRDAALTAYNHARELQQKLVSRSPGNLAYLHELARTYGNAANAQHGLRLFDEALKSLQTACELQQKVMARDPENVEYRVNLGLYLNSLGDRARQRDPKRALAALEQAREIQRELYESDSERTQPTYADDLARTCTNLGTLQAATGDTGPALVSLHEAGELQRGLMTRFPGVADYPAMLARTLVARAGVSVQLKHPADAVKDYEEALSLFEQSGRLDRGRPNLGAMIGVTRRRLLDARARAGDYERAAEGVAELARSPKQSAAGLYQLAALASLSSAAAGRDAVRPLAVREHRAEELARLALTLLGRAAQAGFFARPDSARKLAADPDFAALRGRDQFRALAQGAGP
jgi:eukaryotic-like serine/threonine-protein kinase